jgi:hypothetical protein
MANTKEKSNGTSAVFAVTGFHGQNIQLTKLANSGRGEVASVKMAISPTTNSLFSQKFKVPNAVASETMCRGKVMERFQCHDCNESLRN